MAVERIKKKQETHELGRLKLYRDDLEAIARVLAEFGSLQFTVDDELTGTGSEDFAVLREELPERLTRVTLVAMKEGSAIRVDLGSGPRVVVTEPDMAARGALTSIKEICAPRRARKPGGALSSSLLLLVFVVVIAFGVSGVEPAGWPSLVLMALLAVSGGAILWEKQRGTDSADVILNVPRAERPTFGQRLVADGGVSAFWTGVGALLGLPLGVVASLIAAQLIGS